MEVLLDKGLKKYNKYEKGFIDKFSEQYKIEKKKLEDIEKDFQKEKKKNETLLGELDNLKKTNENINIARNQLQQEVNSSYSQIFHLKSSIEAKESILKENAKEIGELKKILGNNKTIKENNDIKNLSEVNDGIKNENKILKSKINELNNILKINQNDILNFKNMHSNQIYHQIFEVAVKEQLKEYFINEDFFNNLTNLICNIKQLNDSFHSIDSKLKNPSNSLIDYISSLLQSSSTNNNLPQYSIINNYQPTYYPKPPHQTNQNDLKKIACKTINIHYFSLDNSYYQPIINYFEINPPKEIIDSKIKFKIENGIENIGKNENSIAALVIFCCGARTDYSTISEMIERLESKYKKVIIIILLGGSNSTPFIFDQFKGDQINLNYFLSEIKDNQFNKESIKSFCKKLHN